MGEEVIGEMILCEGNKYKVVCDIFNIDDLIEPSTTPCYDARDLLLNFTITLLLSMRNYANSLVRSISPLKYIVSKSGTFPKKSSLDSHPSI